MQNKPKEAGWARRARECRRLRLWKIRTAPREDDDPEFGPLAPRMTYLSTTISHPAKVSLESSAGRDHSMGFFELLETVDKFYNIDRGLSPRGVVSMIFQRGRQWTETPRRPPPKEQSTDLSEASLREILRTLYAPLEGDDTQQAASPDRKKMASKHPATSKVERAPLGPDGREIRHSCAVDFSTTVGRLTDRRRMLSVLPPLESHNLSYEIPREMMLEGSTKGALSFARMLPKEPTRRTIRPQEGIADRPLSSSSSLSSCETNSRPTTTGTTTTLSVDESARSAGVEFGESFARREFAVGQRDDLRPSADAAALRKTPSLSKYSERKGLQRLPFLSDFNADLSSGVVEPANVPKATYDAVDPHVSSVVMSDNAAPQQRSKSQAASLFRTVDGISSLGAGKRLTPLPSPLASERRSIIGGNSDRSEPLPFTERPEIQTPPRSSKSVEAADADAAMLMARRELKNSSKLSKWLADEAESYQKTRDAVVAVLSRRPAQLRSGGGDSAVSYKSPAEEKWERERQLQKVFALLKGKTSSAPP